jgi:hypothetical protein
MESRDLKILYVRTKFLPILLRLCLSEQDMSSLIDSYIIRAKGKHCFLLPSRKTELIFSPSYWLKFLIVILKIDILKIVMLLDDKNQVTKDL